MPLATSARAAAACSLAGLGPTTGCGATNVLEGARPVGGEGCKQVSREAGFHLPGPHPDTKCPPCSPNPGIHAPNLLLLTPKYRTQVPGLPLFLLSEPRCPDFPLLLRTQGSAPPPETLSSLMSRPPLPQNPGVQTPCSQLSNAEALLAPPCSPNPGTQAPPTPSL